MDDAHDVEMRRTLDITSMARLSRLNGVEEMTRTRRSDQSRLPLHVGEDEDKDEPE